jgi:hypothetical protein
MLDSYARDAREPQCRAFQIYLNTWTHCAKKQKTRFDGRWPLTVPLHQIRQVTMRNGTTAQRRRPFRCYTVFICILLVVFGFFVAAQGPETDENVENKEAPRDDTFAAENGLFVLSSSTRVLLSLL